MMMVIFHLLFDLSFFSIAPVNVQTGLWRFFGYATAALFIMIAGTAAVIRLERTPPGTPALQQAAPLLRRGLFLIGIGCLISLVTWIFLRGEGYVVFGILHLIGVSTMLAPLCVRLRSAVLIPGLLLILAGWYLPLPAGPIWAVWAGIHPPDFFSVDYTPLIPWLGVYLTGMAGGVFLYPRGRRSFPLPSRLAPFLAFPALPGRHTLLIYLAHQPLLLALLMVMTGSIPGW